MDILIVSVQKFRSWAANGSHITYIHIITNMQFCLFWLGKFCGQSWILSSSICLSFGTVFLTYISVGNSLNNHQTLGLASSKSFQPRCRKRTVVQKSQSRLDVQENNWGATYSSLSFMHDGVNSYQWKWVCKCRSAWFPCILENLENKKFTIQVLEISLNFIKSGNIVCEKSA